jgi:anti-anti-sigma factor
MERSGGDVAVFLQDDQVLVLLRGDIDLSVGEDLEDAGRDAIDSGIPMTIDVRMVQMIDSVGLSFLIRMGSAAQTGGRRVVLRGPSPPVEELIRIIGAADLFTWILEPDAVPGPAQATGQGPADQIVSG